MGIVADIHTVLADLKAFAATLEGDGRAEFDALLAKLEAELHKL